MEWIMIDHSKVKLMLDSADMQKYALDNCSLDYEDARCRQAVRAILKHVREQTGFDTTGDRVLVQVFPSRDGGCEMFVTRLSEHLPSSCSTPAAPRQVSMVSLRCVAFRFDNLESMIRAARVLARQGYDRGASAWREEQGTWSLFLQEKVRSGILGRRGDLSYLSEYAAPITGQARIACVLEHAECIIRESAVDVLSAL